MPSPSRSLSNTQKPIQKCVDVKFIRDWVPVQARQRIDVAQAWAIIRDHFCAAVYARGVCPVECAACRKQIIDLFRLEEATKPEALLTWLAKDHSAKWIEQLIAAQKDEDFLAQETSGRELTTGQIYDGLFLKRAEDDLFQELLRFYGTSEDNSKE